jgi:CRP/FNR family transcriptional regulator, cyclic AMP receptor protein
MSFGSFFDYPEAEAGTAAEEVVLLPQWSDTEWSRLLPYTTTRRFRAGENVMRSGDVDRSLYFVTAGDVEVLLESPRGRRTRRIALVGAGSVIGEQAFVDGQPRSATVRAISDSELLRLSEDAFESFAARDPALAMDLIFDIARILSLRLRTNQALIARSLGS